MQMINYTFTNDMGLASEETLLLVILLSPYLAQRFGILQRMPRGW